MNIHDLVKELTGATDTKVANLQEQFPNLTLSRFSPDGGCDSLAYEQCLKDHAGQCGVCSCPDGGFLICP